MLFSTLQGFVPMYVNATAGTTVYGAFDPINEIADICEKYNMWLHVDVRESRKSSLATVINVTFRLPCGKCAVSYPGCVGRRSADVQEAQTQAEWNREVEEHNTHV